MDKAIEAAARALMPHLRFYGDGDGYAVTIAGKTIKAFLSALKEDPEVVERVARAMFDDEIQANPKRDPEKTWKDEDLIWLSNARAALSALEVE